MNHENCIKIEKYIVSKKPTTASRIVSDLNIFYPNMLDAVNQLIKEKKVIIFETENGSYYAKRGWKP